MAAPAPLPPSQVPFLLFEDITVNNDFQKRLVWLLVHRYAMDPRDIALAILQANQGQPT